MVSIGSISNKIQLSVNLKITFIRDVHVMYGLPVTLSIHLFISFNIGPINTKLENVLIRSF